MTWWAFLGTLVSVLASVAGSWFGAGPRFRLVRVPYLRAGGASLHAPVAGVSR